MIGHLYTWPARQQLPELAPVQHHQLPVRRPRRINLRPTIEIDIATEVATLIGRDWQLIQAISIATTSDAIRMLMHRCPDNTSHV